MQQIAAASKHLRVIGFNRKNFITIKKMTCNLQVKIQVTHSGCYEVFCENVSYR